MNLSTTIFLINSDVRCISVSYDKRATSKGDEPLNTRAFKTLDTSIAKNDFVVIPSDTRWGFTVGRVEEVDTRVDFASFEEMRWIAGKVPLDAYSTTVNEEQVVLNKINYANEIALRKELADKILAAGPDLAGLALVKPLNPTLPREGPEAPHRGGQQSEGQTG